VRFDPVINLLKLKDKIIMNLSIKNVSKQYGRDVWGLRKFSLEIGPGVLDLLEPNGAGKSTLMTNFAGQYLDLAQDIGMYRLG
jgi:ABC-type multidrug transport system ATPase subunit